MGKEAFIYLIFFTIWIIRLYYKLYDERTKKYILFIGFLIIFWMLIRIFKDIIDISFLVRYCWYLYYVPLIFIPFLFYVFSDSLNNGMSSKKFYFLLVVAILLFGFVITNDLHRLVFRFNDGISNFNDYTHFYGYYIICVYIFSLYVCGVINLVVKSFKTKKSYKSFLPFLMILLGILYTYLYIKGVPFIAHSNLSVVLSFFICLGIEIMFYIDLIPNNSKYKKYFINSDLDMVIVSLNGNILYTTKSFNVVPIFIIDDIKNNCVLDCYDEVNVLYDVKRNKDSYVILRNDISVLNKLKEELSIKQKELIVQQEALKSEEKIKKELYEIDLRKRIVLELEDSLYKKRIVARDILNKSDISSSDLEKLKLIIAYCKRKSFLIISELNDDLYDEDGIKLIINELLCDFNFLNINGAVMVNKMCCDSYIMSKIYEKVFDVLYRVSDLDVVIFIDSDYLKFEISGVCVEEFSFLEDCLIKTYDNDISISFSLR